MPERLQKLISEAGLMSRRAAEKLIAEGRVTVNGRVAALGEKAGPEDTVVVDGKRLKTGAEKTYIMLNKPKGFVTTLSDEKGRKNVSMLVADAGVRLYPVGRLDLNSEGLLIMTNDGDFANRLMHPSNNVLKTYEVIVSGEDILAACRKLSGPVVVDGTEVIARSVDCSGVDGKTALVRITIGEGKNRQIRKMCAFAGLKVLNLRRISEGHLKLGELKSGKWRYLSPDEIITVLQG